MTLLLQQKQMTKLLMTTQLRQSIELLEYSIADLENYIREQALANPLIELKEPAYKTRQQIQNSSISYDPFEFIKHENDFREDLLQLATLDKNCPIPYVLLKQIIYNLDDNGYLSSESFCHIEQKKIDDAIFYLQTIGPAGIAARNLQECLYLQAVSLPKRVPLVENILLHYFEEFANTQYGTIIEHENCSTAQIIRAKKVIQQFKPKPCAYFTNNTNEQIIPDILITNKYGQFTFTLHTSMLPQITLSSEYNDFFEHPDTKQYLQAQQKHLHWLRQSIEQRQKTMYSLMEVIIHTQQQFFHHGFTALKPLILKEVAQQIGVHESTVSRTVKNKWIATPFGTIQLKMLFSKSINQNEKSQTAIKLLIKQIIEQEDPQRPLTDEKICSVLIGDYATKISRRTVNKYREQLNIPATSKRKKLLT